MCLGLGRIGDYFVINQATVRLAVMAGNSDLQSW